MSHYFSEFLALALIHLLAVIAPGPDFAITVRQSIRFGRRVGIVTAVGIGAGISVHVLYTLLGAGALIHTTPWLMTLAKVVGSGYLCYLGLQLLRSKPSTSTVASSDSPSSTHSSPRQAFMVGFMTNVLNPKAPLFFLSVFTTLVDPNTPISVQMFYGLWMCGVNAGWFMLVSVLFSQSLIRQHFLRMGHWFERLMGLLLLIFAGRLLMTYL